MYEENQSGHPKKGSWRKLKGPEAGGGELCLQSSHITYCVTVSTDVQYKQDPLTNRYHTILKVSHTHESHDFCEEVRFPSCDRNHDFMIGL